MDKEKILEQFEDEVVAGKNPSIKDYETKYGPLDKETRGLMQTMLLLDKTGAAMSLPPEMEESQRTACRKFIARQYLNQAMDAFCRNDFGQARKHFALALKYHEEEKHYAWLGFEHFVMAMMDTLEDKFDEALEHYRQSADYYARAEDRRNEIAALVNLAQTALSIGKAAQAKPAYLKLLPLAEESGQTEVVIHSLMNLGIIEMWAGNVKQSYDLFHDVLKLAEESKDMKMMASAYHNLGVLAEGSGGVKTAIEMYHKSLAISRQGKHYDLISQTAGVLGAVYAAHNRLQEASECYNEAVEAVDKLMGSSKHPAAVQFRRALGAGGLQSTEEIMADFRSRLKQDQLPEVVP